MYGKKDKDSSLPQLNLKGTNQDDKNRKRQDGSMLPAASPKVSQPQTSRAKPEDSSTFQPQQPATARPARVSSGRRQPSVTGAKTSASPTGNGQAPTRQSTRTKKVTKQSMTIAEVMQKHADKLTPFEQSEILEYQHIYFVGLHEKKKIKGIPHTTNNSGYDDDRGDYKIVIGDHMEYRYEVLKTLGRGSFGQVVKAMDHKKDQIVALKIIRNKKRFHHQALVEVKILEHLMAKDKEHKSGIVRVYGYFYFRNHLCITFEPLSINLYEFIKRNEFQGLSLSLIRRFAIQLLNSLKFLAQENIVHCDLKPENVLLKGNKSAIKLIDFGSSCFTKEPVYTYIQSRFYRSPEVILGMNYGIEIDMWSFGCILSELYTGYPLFPGENEAEQMQCMMEVLGEPPKQLIKDAKRKTVFFDEALRPKLKENSRGKKRKPGGKDLEMVTKCKDNLFLSFLEKCLRWDPKQRLTPSAAMREPWILENSSKTSTRNESTRKDDGRVAGRIEASTPDEGPNNPNDAANRTAESKALFPPIKGSGD